MSSIFHCLSLKSYRIIVSEVAGMYVQRCPKLVSNEISAKYVILKSRSSYMDAGSPDLRKPQATTMDEKCPDFLPYMKCNALSRARCVTVPPA